MMHFTHSHTSPDMTGIFPNRLRNFLRTDVQYPVLHYIMHQLIFAGKNAFRSATIRAKIGFGFSGELPRPFAVQRRPPYKVFTDPIRILKITDEDENIIGVIVNYQGNPTQLPQENSDFSAEYPGAICRALFQHIPHLQFGTYFNGFIGDVSASGYKGFYHAILEGKNKEEAIQVALDGVQRLGNEIVDVIMPVLDSIPVKPISNVSVHRRFIFPEVFREKPFHERLKHYKTIRGKLHLFYREFRTAMRVGFLIYGYWAINGRPLPMLNILKNGRKLHHQTELYVYQINDLTWFCSPGEPFSMYQEKLTNLVPEHKAFFNCMANDTCGYIFPWDFYVKGGYEITFSYDMLFGQYLYKTFKEELLKVQNEEHYA